MLPPPFSLDLQSSIKSSRDREARGRSDLNGLHAERERGIMRLCHVSLRIQELLGGSEFNILGGSEERDERLLHHENCVLVLREVRQSQGRRTKMRGEGTSMVELTTWEIMALDLDHVSTL